MFTGQPVATLAFIQNIGMMEWVVILVIALLLFGRRLPEVGRSLGKGIVEFKKGLKGVEDEVDLASNRPVAPAWQQPAAQLNTAPPSVPMGQPNTVGRADGQ